MGFSSCSTWPQYLWLTGSKLLAEWLWRPGLLAPRPWRMGSSWTRDQTHIPCIGMWILNHCTHQKSPCFVFLVTSLEVTICLSTFHNLLLKLLNYLSYLFLIYLFMYNVRTYQYKLISPALGQIRSDQISRSVVSDSLRPTLIIYFTSIYVISHKIHCHYFCFK